MQHFLDVRNEMIEKHKTAEYIADFKLLSKELRLNLEQVIERELIFLQKCIRQNPYRQRWKTTFNYDLYISSQFQSYFKDGSFSLFQIWVGGFYTQDDNFIPIIPDQKPFQILKDIQEKYKSYGYNIKQVLKNDDYFEITLSCEMDTV